MWRFIAVLALLSAVLTATPSAAAAPAGLTITPAIEQLTLPSGDQPTHFATQLTNSTSESRTLALSAEDFTYFGSDGAIRFVEPGTASPGAHGLAQAIRFDTDIVRLKPHQTITIEVSIVHPNLLAPGGHYAAVLYREVDPTKSGGINIGLKPAVTTLLFVSTAGQGSVTLQLTNPPTGGLLTSVPGTVDTVFADTGNTQTAVHGIIQILAGSGQLMSQGVINVDSSLILPGASRLFAVDLTPQGGGYWWPGFYQVRVLYRHDAQTKYTIFSQTVLYIDGRILAVLGVASLLGAIVILRRAGPGRLYLLRSRISD